MSPFPNDYTARLVSEADSKPCNICYKPTSTVMVAANKGDFFYVCPMHLKDVTLATPVHPEEYTSLLSQKKDLEERVRKANATAESNRPYSWSSITSKIGFSQAKDGEKESELDRKISKKEAKSYQDYVNQANVLKKELTDLTSSISTYQFKKFTLNGEFYKSRVNSKVQGAMRAKRQQDIQNGSFFPSAPTQTPGAIE